MFEASMDKIEAELIALIKENQHILTDFVGQKASDLVNDDAAMSELAAKLYTLLPALLQSMVSQQQLTAFILANRQRVVAAIQAAGQASGAPRA